MTKTENRVHPRSQYFLLQEEGQPVPVYAFRDADDVVATPALVVDMSDGSVLTASTPEPVLRSGKAVRPPRFWSATCPRRSTICCDAFFTL